jgi:DNA-binding NtrC family response regulator
LEDQVKDGKFREDLYYRLNVVNINVPPLRSRREDVEPLSRYFLDKYTAETGKKISDLSPRALSCLLAHDWPGNVRELQNAIERAVVLSKGSVLTPRDFPQGMQGDDQIIIQTLQREDGSQTRAAETLGIKRTTLRYKMEKYRMID